jgi:hypothetical protein
MHFQRHADIVNSAAAQENRAELDAWGKALQIQLHKQGFSTAPVDDFLKHIKDKMPEIAKSAGVGPIVSKWDKETLAKYKSAEQVDRRKGHGVHVNSGCQEEQCDCDNHRGDAQPKQAFRREFVGGIPNFFVFQRLANSKPVQVVWRDFTPYQWQRKPAQQQAHRNVQDEH